MMENFGLSELRKGLDTGRFSSVEVVKDCLAKARENEDLNCFTELLQEKALADAAEADRLINSSKAKEKPLLGIPVAIKDIICTLGSRTTCASKILENYRSPYEATAARKLRKAGAVIIGKTNMDEFAMGSSSENSAVGPVLNPWDKARVPGGSSGGSAACVAAGIAPVALGTDTGGSIRQPASFCGVVGIKPTYGRVSRYGVVAFASSLDQIGPFALNVKDAALITSVISGKDENDSTSMEVDPVRLTDIENGDLKGLRAGVPREYFIEGLDADVERCIRAAMKELEALGVELVDVSLPHTDAAVAVYYILAPAEASSNLARFDGVRYGYRTKDASNLKEMYFATRGEGFGPEVKRRIMIGTYVLSTGYYDAYYLRAQKVRNLIAKDFRDAFESKCDFIVCPAAPTTAFRIGEKIEDPLSMYLNDIFTIPVNLAGLPGMSIPCGFDSKNMPVGLQLIGRPFDEEMLFRVGCAFETVSNWHKKRPGGVNQET